MRLTFEMDPGLILSKPICAQTKGKSLKADWEGNLGKNLIKHRVGP